MTAIDEWGNARSELRVAVVGAGYWGPNLVRNFRGSPEWDLVAVCDLDGDRARKVIGARSTVEVETSLSDCWSGRHRCDGHRHAGSLACAYRIGRIGRASTCWWRSPWPTHLKLRHRWCSRRRAGRVLMIDHTYCYTPAVQYIRKIVADGVLGDILYIDSSRINLGLVQPDVNVFWDLAPHDLSILDFIVPGGLRPETVSATGSDPLGAGKACVGYLSMPLSWRVASPTSTSTGFLRPRSVRW